MMVTPHCTAGGKKLPASPPSVRCVVVAAAAAAAATLAWRYSVWSFLKLQLLFFFPPSFLPLCHSSLVVMIVRSTQLKLAAEQSRAKQRGQASSSFFLPVCILEEEEEEMLPKGRKKGGFQFSALRSRSESVTKHVCTSVRLSWKSRFLLLFLLSIERDKRGRGRSGRKRCCCCA